MPECKRVEIRFRCPTSTCRRWIRHSVTRSGTEDIDCRTCGGRQRLDVAPKMADRGLVERCASCGGSEFFIRKDFPQRFGLLLVLVFGIAASVFYYREEIAATFVTMAVLVVIDALLYRFVGRVTVCYRCRTEYRNTAYNPASTGFDLATSEKYG